MRMSLGNNRPALRSVAGLRICRTWVSSTDALRSSLNCRHEKHGDCRNPQFKLEAYKLQIETANCIAVYWRILAQPSRVSEQRLSNDDDEDDEDDEDEYVTRDD
ncbi:hypothetical protein K0M31_004401 [Melipona bicolor]|uniref:Uncharacterized protein n=1 Tax=Melipona bicolor TaxID=60889 RepID=A0AA40FWQ6_9HYME|nr:hypothetical protein K0M31_004401 [Melipona bicolor]